MNIRYLFSIIFGEFNKESEEYEKRLILRFLIIWSALILLSFIIFLYTKNFWALFIWVAFYAIYRRQCLYDKELNKNFNIINSNKTVKILDYLFKVVFAIIIIRYALLNYLL